MKTMLLIFFALNFLSCNFINKNNLLEELLSEQEISKKIDYIPTDTYYVLNRGGIPIERIKNIFGIPASIYENNTYRVMSYELKNGIMNLYSKDDLSICGGSIWSNGIGPFVEFYTNAKLGKTKFSEFDSVYRDVFFMHAINSGVIVFNFESGMTVNQNTCTLVSGEISTVDYNKKYSENLYLDYDNNKGPNLIGRGKLAFNEKCIPKNLAFGDCEIINSENFIENLR